MNGLRKSLGPEDKTKQQEHRMNKKPSRRRKEENYAVLRTSAMKD